MESRLVTAVNETSKRAFGPPLTVIDASRDPIKVLKLLMEGPGPNPKTGILFINFKGIPVARAHTPFDLIYMDEDLRVLQAAEISPTSSFQKFKGQPETALVLPPRCIHDSKTFTGDQIAIHVQTTGEVEAPPARPAAAKLPPRVVPASAPKSYNVPGSPTMAPASGSLLRGAGASIRRPAGAEEPDQGLEKVAAAAIEQKPAAVEAVATPVEPVVVPIEPVATPAEAAVVPIEPVAAQVEEAATPVEVVPSAASAEETSAAAPETVTAASFVAPPVAEVPPETKTEEQIPEVPPAAEAVASPLVEEAAPVETAVSEASVVETGSAVEERPPSEPATVAAADPEAAVEALPEPIGAAVPESVRAVQEAVPAAVTEVVPETRAEVVAEPSPEEVDLPSELAVSPVQTSAAVPAVEDVAPVLPTVATAEAETPAEASDDPDEIWLAQAQPDERRVKEQPTSIAPAGVPDAAEVLQEEPAVPMVSPEEQPVAASAVDIFKTEESLQEPIPAAPAAAGQYQPRDFAEEEITAATAQLGPEIVPALPPIARVETPTKRIEVPPATSLPPVPSQPPEPLYKEQAEVASLPGATEIHKASEPSEPHLVIVRSQRPKGAKGKSFVAQPAEPDTSLASLFSAGIGAPPPPTSLPPPPSPEERKRLEVADTLSKRWDVKLIYKLFPELSPEYRPDIEPPRIDPIKEMQKKPEPKAPKKVRFLSTLYPDLQLDTVKERQRRARRAPRIAVPGLVGYYFTGGKPVPYEIRNISVTGFYMLTTVRWSPGTIIRVTLQIADSDGENPADTVTVHSRVVNWDRTGAGFEFVLPGFMEEDRR